MQKVQISVVSIDMSTKRVKSKLVEPVEELARPVMTARYLVSKGIANELLDRVLALPPGAVMRITTEEMRLWRDHVVVING